MTRRMVAAGAQSWAGARAEWELPAGPGSARIARDLLRSWLPKVGIDTDGDGKGADIVLAVSEAVANAAVHGVPPVRLLVTVTGAGGGAVAVECSISDSGEGLPLVPAQARPDAEHGRGQQIIAALGDRWGFYQLPQGGQLAWFEFTDVPVTALASEQDPAPQGRRSWHELPGEVLAS